MDNAFERARAAYGTGAYDDATLEFLFPQLKESEDEKIRKDIVAAVEMYGDFTQSRKEEIYAYLEKQKEQKPVVTHGETYRVDTLGTQQVIAGKMPQKPAEWSEEDEKIITRLIGYFESFRIAGVATKWEGLGVQEVITLLKSLRPSWKPSEEQMKALKYAAYHMLPGEEYRDVLFSLFKDLKELM